LLGSNLGGVAKIERVALWFPIATDGRTSNPNP
jgi:hypothetical protein